MTINKLTDNVQPLDIISTVNELIDSSGGGGSYTLPVATTSTLGGVKIDGSSITIDNNGVISSSGSSATTVQINGTSITSQGVANILTNSAYNESTNKIATMSDLPSTSGFEVATNKITSISASSTDTQYPTAKLLYDQLALKQNNLTAVGSASQPVYVNSSGVITGCTYPLPISVSTLSTSGTVSLTDNSINTITPTAAVTFSLPTVTDNTVFHQILVQVNLSTAYSLTLGTTYYFSKTEPDMSAVGQYNLFYEYDVAQAHWVVGCVAKGSAS